MDEHELIAYFPALRAATGLMVLFILQTLVGAVARMRAKQLPGVTIEGGHDRFLFRADRARANTIEVTAAFLLVLFLATQLGALSAMVNGGAILFLVGRVAHMFFYYAGLQRPRAVSFMAGNIGMVIILMSVVRYWIAV